MADSEWHDSNRFRAYPFIRTGSAGESAQLWSSGSGILQLTAREDTYLSEGYAAEEGTLFPWRDSWIVDMGVWMGPHIDAVICLYQIVVWSGRAWFEFRCVGVPERGFLFLRDMRYPDWSVPHPRYVSVHTRAILRPPVDIDTDTAPPTVVQIGSQMPDLVAPGIEDPDTGHAYVVFGDLADLSDLDRNTYFHLQPVVPIILEQCQARSYSRGISMNAATQSGVDLQQPGAVDYIPTVQGLQGAVQLLAGYNTALAWDSDQNTLQISVSAGAGLGQPCADPIRHRPVPIDVGPTALLRALEGSIQIDGGADYTFWQDSIIEHASQLYDFGIRRIVVPSLPGAWSEQYYSAYSSTGLAIVPGLIVHHVHLDYYGMQGTDFIDPDNDTTESHPRTATCLLEPGFWRILEQRTVQICDSASSLWAYWDMGAALRSVAYSEYTLSAIRSFMRSAVTRLLQRGIHILVDQALYAEDVSLSHVPALLAPTGPLDPLALVRYLCGVPLWVQGSYIPDIDNELDALKALHYGAEQLLPVILGPNRVDGDRTGASTASLVDWAVAHPSYAGTLVWTLERDEIEALGDILAYAPSLPAPAPVSSRLPCDDLIHTISRLSPDEHGNILIQGGQGITIETDPVSHKLTIRINPFARQVCD